MKDELFESWKNFRIKNTESPKYLGGQFEDDEEGGRGMVKCSDGTSYTYEWWVKNGQLFYDRCDDVGHA